MKRGIYHYWLGEDGEVRTAPAATDGPSIAYMHPERDTLCVMEGGSYHQFDIGRLQMTRLMADLAARLWQKERP